MVWQLAKMRAEKDMSKDRFFREFVQMREDVRMPVMGFALTGFLRGGMI